MNPDKPKLDEELIRKSKEDTGYARPPITKDVCRTYRREDCEDGGSGEFLEFVSAKGGCSVPTSEEACHRINPNAVYEKNICRYPENDAECAQKTPDTPKFDALLQRELIKGVQRWKETKWVKQPDRYVEDLTKYPCREYKQSDCDAGKYFDTAENKCVVPSNDAQCKSVYENTHIHDSTATTKCRPLTQSDCDDKSQILNAKGENANPAPRIGPYSTNTSSTCRQHRS